MARELAYCVPKGLPHSTFLTWPEEDQDKALAWEQEQRLKCPGCGTRDDEWRDEEGIPRAPAPYDVVDFKCEGCRELELFKAREEINNTPGVYVSLRPHVIDRAELHDDSDEGSN